MSRAIIGKSILFICVSLLISVTLSVAEYQSKEHNYWPTKGWRTSTPEAQRMRSDVLADMLWYVHLILRNCWKLEIIYKSTQKQSPLFRVCGGHRVTGAFTWNLTPIPLVTFDHLRAFSSP
jgi:hypothetical protein